MPKWWVDRISFEFSNELISSQGHSTKSSWIYYGVHISSFLGWSDAAWFSLKLSYPISGLVSIETTLWTFQARKCQSVTDQGLVVLWKVEMCLEDPFWKKNPCHMSQRNSTAWWTFWLWWFLVKFIYNEPAQIWEFFLKKQ